MHADTEHIPESSKLVFNKLQLRYGEDHCNINVTLELGSQYFVTTDKSWVQRELLGLLKRYEPVRTGEITINNLSLNDYDVLELRQAVTILDRSLIIEVSIERYLKLAQPKATQTDIRKALEEVELASAIDALSEGLKTQVSVLGAPLQPLEFLLLKLAAAIIAKPQILILNQHFDAIPPDLRLRLLQRLKDHDFTVLYFTNKPLKKFATGLLHLHDEAEVYLY